MAKLNFTIDTEDMYEGGMGFEDLLTDSLRKEIAQECKNRVALDTFKEFSDLTANTIISGIKLKMEKFLSEEIALTDKWGKPQFVGSIEDLIKNRFDDVLLRPVDSYGKNIQGCTTTGQTWIEWKIKNTLDEKLNSHIRNATTQLEKYIKNKVDLKLSEIKDNTIKQEVDAVFSSILKNAIIE